MRIFLVQKKLILLGCLFLFFSCKKEKINTTNQWSLSNEAFNELLILSDTSTLTNYNEFDRRIARIQEIFAQHNDNRGAFPTIYKAITHAAVVSIENGDYQDSLFIYNFAMDFSKGYLYFLRHHLLNEPLEYHWDLYYNHCKNNTHITRLVLEGINAHVTLDLTRSLAINNVQHHHKEDWILFGDKTVIAVPEFLTELEQEYNTDASGIFGLFEIGDFLDEIFGEGATINFGFNVLRMESFNFAIPLQNNSVQHSIEQNMKHSFYTKEDIFKVLDDLKLTP